MCETHSHNHKNLPALTKTVKITKIIKKNDRISTIVLDDKIKCDPGQFIMLWIPRVDEKPYSVDIPDPLTVTFAKYGSFTKALSNLKVGDKIGWRGPLGKGFQIHGKKVLVVAGGVGLASVSNLVRTMRSQDIEVDLVVGSRTKDELYDLEKFKNLGVNVFPTTDDGTHGFHGFTTQQSEILLAENTYDQAYVCGPEVMMVKLAEIFDKADLLYQMSLERYMKCGFGICDQCACGDKLVCIDGPVFNQDQIRGLDEFGKIYRTMSGEEVGI